MSNESIPVTINKSPWKSTPTTGKLALNKWTYIQIDSAYVKWGDFAQPEWLLLKLLNRDWPLAMWMGLVIWIFSALPGIIIVTCISGAMTRLTFSENAMFL